jgi:hypothetical protein
MLTLSSRNDDHERAFLCLQSLDRQLLSPLAVTILCPPADTDIVMSRLGREGTWRRIGVEVRDETSLLGDDIASDAGVRGTVRQMLLKLCFAEICDTSHYLTLDADVALVLPLEPAMLFRGSQGLLEHKLNAADSDWYRAAAKLLGTPISYTAGMQVTPALLARAAARDLIGFLAKRHGNWRRVLANAHATGDRWTEYALYYHHLLSTDAFARHHFSAPGCALHTRRSVWRPHQVEQWSLVAAQAGPGWFTVLQSSAGIPPHRAKEMLAPVLGLATASSAAGAAA